MTSDPVDVRLGAFIRRYRQAADVSSAELAARLDKTVQWVRDLEAGQIRISSVYARELSSALGVSIDEFFARADAEPLAGMALVAH